MNKLTTLTIAPHKFEQITASAGRSAMSLELARLALSVSVPLSIVDLRYIGGPQDYHVKAVQQRAAQQRNNGSGGADLIFGGRQSGHEMSLLCDMVAIMAFQPGGVTLFGLRFEACVPESEASK